MTIKCGMIMGAGMGTRMKPLTLHTPKPLIPFRGKPLIDYALEAIKAHGIQTIVVNTHYLANQMHAYLIKNHPDVIISHEVEILETGGGVKAALSHVNESPLLVINPDIAFTTGITSLIDGLEKAWNTSQMDALLALCPKNRCHSFFGSGDYDFSQNSRITWRGAKSESSHFYTGISLIKPEAYDLITETYFSNKNVWDLLEAKERLSGWEITGHAYDISSVSGLKHADEAFMNE